MHDHLTIDNSTERRDLKGGSHGESKYLGIYQRFLVLLHRHVHCAPVASECGVRTVEFYRFCVGCQGAGEVFRFQQLVSPGVQHRGGHCREKQTIGTSWTRHSLNATIASSGHQRQRERLNAYCTLQAIYFVHVAGRSKTAAANRQPVHNQEGPVKQTRHGVQCRKGVARPKLQEIQNPAAVDLMNATVTQHKQNSMYIGKHLPCASSNETQLKTRRASSFAEAEKNWTSHLVLAATAASRCSRVLGGEVFPSSPRP